MLLLAIGTEASSNTEAEHVNHPSSESTIDSTLWRSLLSLCTGDQQVHIRNEKTKLHRAIQTAQSHSDCCSQARGHSATVIRCTWPSARIYVQLTSQNILQLKMSNVFKSKLLGNAKKQAERGQSLPYVYFSRVSSSCKRLDV